MFLLKFFIAYALVILTAELLGMVEGAWAAWDLFTMLVIVLLVYSISLVFDSCAEWKRQRKGR